MKKRNVYTLLIFVLAGVAGQAQPYYGWRLGAGVGGAAYSGEVSYRPGTTKVSWPAYQLLLGRSLGPSLDVELNAGWGQFSASDRATDWRGKLRTDNPNFSRGLHFRTRFRNAALLLQYKFNNGYLLSQYARLAPYAFAGGGVTDFTVYGDPQRDGSFTTELSAPESGADYPTRVLTVPFGGGVRWHVSDRLSADLRAGAQYAFTDYLDHVKAGRGRDVYFTTGLSLQYRFGLGGDKFRGPVAYAGSEAFAPPGTGAVSTAGNRTELFDIERVRPDLDVQALDSDRAAGLADALVEEQRVQPQPAPVHDPDTRRAGREEKPQRLQPRDLMTRADAATQASPGAVPPGRTPPAPAYRPGTEHSVTAQPAPDAGRNDANPAQPAAAAPRRYDRNGRMDADAPAYQARVQRLESQVAALHQQLEALRRASRQPDQLPRNGSLQAAIPASPAGVERQPAQLPADRSIGKQLDSLFTRVTQLGARLDTALAALKGAQPAMTPQLTAGSSPAANDDAGSGNRDDTGNDAPERVAAATNARLDAVLRQLEELRRSVDAVQNRMDAANRTAASPERLPYGPLVIYYPLNSAVMGPGDRQRVAAVAGRLAADSSAVVEIKGFADQTGNAAYNLALSRRRAANLRDYLVGALGVKPQQVVVNYFGQALAGQEKENPYDRRVELEIYVDGE